MYVINPDHWVLAKLQQGYGLTREQAHDVAELIERQVGTFGDASAERLDRAARLAIEALGITSRKGITCAP